MRCFWGGVAGVLLGTAGAVAEPATITAQSPEAMAKVMRSFGYRAQLTTDGDGDPLIRSAASGLKYGIYFYGCEDGTACTTVQFYLGLKVDRNVGLTELNDWNLKKRFGTAVLDDDDQPSLTLDLNLDYGGITTPAFEDNPENWERLMADFADHLRFGDTASPHEKAAPDVGPPKEL